MAQGGWGSNQPYKKINSWDTYWQLQPCTMLPQSHYYMTLLRDYYEDAEMCLIYEKIIVPIIKNVLPLTILWLWNFCFCWDRKQSPRENRRLRILLNSSMIYWAKTTFFSTIDFPRIPREGRRSPLMHRINSLSNIIYSYTWLTKMLGLDP